MQPLNNHIFMANQAGYKDNPGDVGSTTLPWPDNPRRRRLEAGRQRPQKDGRTLELGA